MKRRHMENKYILHDYIDAQIYTIFATAPRGSRKPRMNTTSDVQQRLNDENSFLRADRLVHANFTSDDYLIDLTYSIQPTNESEANKRIKNYIVRLRTLYKKVGKELKYFYVTEQGTKSNRWHHHLIINSGIDSGIDRNTVEDAWKKKDYAGRANCDRLQFTKTGISDRVAYMCGRKGSKSKPLAKRSKGTRKWKHSRNLVKPKLTQTKTRIRLKDVEEIFCEPEDRCIWERLYPGYSLGECRRCYYNEVNGGYYISARLYKKDIAHIIKMRI